ncbi:MAG: TonB-dependent receptor [Hyphomonadaceae bacterium]|nr:TonB-dependent receptor [Hyphomonadaceae bacterium]
MAQFKRFPLVSLLALGFAMPAMAQNTPAQSAEGPQTAPQTAPQTSPRDDDRDVVVVTASKREETVQDIAVAVTAITSELRDEIGLTTVQDYTNFAPGLSYSTSNDRLGMRGVTRTTNNFGIRSGISNYVDGVYFSSAIPASREPIFIDRVEVVRGPQGTLYGRDSIGGALNVITKRPTEEFEGQFNLAYGAFETLNVETTIAGPITDWLRYRVGASRSSQEEGYLTNYSGLPTEGGRRNDSYIEGQLEGNIGDRFDWWVRGGTLSWDVRYGAPGARTSGDDQQPYDTRYLPPGAIVPSGFFGFSGVATNVSMTGSQTTNPGITDSRGFNTDFSNFAHLNPTQEYALEAVWHADNFDIKYLGGYVWYHYNLQQDNDGSPVRSYNLAGRTIQTQRVSDYNENRMWYSNELNFISTGDGPLSWIAGLYQYQENYTQPIYVSNTGNIGGFIQRLADVQAFNFGAAQPDLPDFTGRNSNSGSQIGGDLYFHTNNQGLNNAYGVFLQTDYQFNDQWKLTAGIRWSKDVMHGREYSRLTTLYSTEAALEAGFAPFAGLFGGTAVLNSLIQPRTDVTATLGGPDPTTITAANPCGFAAAGVVNANPTAANGGAGCGGANDRSRYGIYFDPLTGNAQRELAAEWHEVTGVIGLDWTPDTDTLIYAKYNRGYKPGGLGAAATFGLMVPTPYTDKELVDAVELGFKREWPEWDLTTNAVLFYYDYQGYQVSNTIVPEDPDDAGPLPRPPAYAAYVNLPTTTTTGFELETIWHATDNLRFLFNYGYTNPEIGDSPSLIHALDPFAMDQDAQPFGTPVPFTAAQLAACPIARGGNNATAPLTTPNCTRQQGQNLNGNILPGSPKHKIAFNSTYTWDFEDGSNVVGSISYLWQDISYNSIFNRWTTKVPAWDQIDGRLSWTNADGNITLIGFVRNLLDDDVYDGRGVGRRQGNNRDVSPGLCGTTAANSVLHSGTLPNGSAASPLGSLQEDCYTVTNTYRPPRTWGAELQFRF